LILSDKVLETLSFFNEMTLEQIYLDFEEDYFVENRHLTNEDLTKCLKILVKSKRVKSIKKGKIQSWIRIYPKKSLLTRMFEYLKSLHKTNK